MANPKKTTRKVLQSLSDATRILPRATRKRGERLGDRVYAAFEVAETDWLHDSLPPCGDPNITGDGFIRKTDAELRLFEIIVHAKLSVDTGTRGTAAELAFNLHCLAAELSRVADALTENHGVDRDGDE